MKGLGMKYFVLKPGGKDAYAKASREAMRLYSLSIRFENEKLSLDLMDWVSRETKKASKNISVSYGCETSR